jgi:hypothetical protein
VNERRYAAVVHVGLLFAKPPGISRVALHLVVRQTLNCHFVNPEGLTCT